MSLTHFEIVSLVYSQSKNILNLIVNKDENTHRYAVRGKERVREKKER